MPTSGPLHKTLKDSQRGVKGFYWKKYPLLLLLSLSLPCFTFLCGASRHVKLFVCCPSLLLESALHEGRDFCLVWYYIPGAKSVPVTSGHSMNTSWTNEWKLYHHYFTCEDSESQKVKWLDHHYRQRDRLSVYAHDLEIWAISTTPCDSTPWKFLLVINDELELWCTALPHKEQW